MYRLDYSKGPRAWRFSPDGFAHTEEEQSVDLLLYKLSFVGTLLASGDIHIRDLDWLRSGAAIVLQNDSVLRYLNWLQSEDQIPGHASFAGAVHLYNAMFGPSGSAHAQLNRYLQRAKISHGSDEVGISNGA